MKFLKFFLLVFGLSAPFWVLGAVAKELTNSLPVKLPISALMAVCLLAAALILRKQESKDGGGKELVKRIFDGEKVTDKRWYLLLIFLMPASTESGLARPDRAGGHLNLFDPGTAAGEVNKKPDQLPE